MMPFEVLKRLFEYDRWANERIANALLNCEMQDESTDRLYAHILGAQSVWLARMREQTPRLAVWPVIERTAWADELQNLHIEWIGELEARFDEFNSLIRYHNSSGMYFETALTDILTHVIIHGQHHRAQIALLLRQAGYSPPPTDFIVFTREGARGLL